ncbi:hypothetical protein GGX14DRAFT_669842 [Mycena pura]|uniref:C2H2-type domain-containing protein n=1 Tax=Mycena pura TaxID=153505 RepID=A0AAD6YK72_9AGAR|nr:hypothetical protein GGX14DRAFT_669842 [Mycena pura]
MYSEVPRSPPMSRPASIYPLPLKGEDNGATCVICGVFLRRNTDLPRHMLTHSKDKESLMFRCPMDGCGHQTLQKSNLATHIRTHTRAKPHKCPESFPNGQKCDFSTADPSSLHRHRKRKHGYTPRPKPAPPPRAAVLAYVPKPCEGDVDVDADAEGDVDAEGEPASDYESEESFGMRARGSCAAHGGGGGEDNEGKPGHKSVSALPIDNVSAERMEPSPALTPGIDYQSVLSPGVDHLSAAAASASVELTVNTPAPVSDTR